MRHLLALLTAAGLAGASTGCFHYVPSTDSPPQGTTVRAHLTRPLPIELPELTANDVVEVQGEMVSSQDDRLILSAFALATAGDFEHRAGGATVSLPRDALGLLEQRQISAGRTALAAIALAGAGYLIQLGLRGATGGSDSGNGGGPAK